MKGKRGPSKILVILPQSDVKKIEEEVLEGRYVTKSDFLRAAVKQLLYNERGIKISEAKGVQLQERLAEGETQSGSSLSKKEILKIMEENRDVIRRFGVKKIGLFGSYARAEQRPESDVDILVEFSKGNKNFHNYMQLKLFLESAFSRKVDLVIKGSVRPELRNNIFGDVVYA